MLSCTELSPLLLSWLKTSRVSAKNIAFDTHYVLRCDLHVLYSLLYTRRGRYDTDHASVIYVEISSTWFVDVSENAPSFRSQYTIVENHQLSLLDDQINSDGRVVHTWHTFGNEQNVMSWRSGFLRQTRLTQPKFWLTVYIFDSLNFVDVPMHRRQEWS